MVIVLALCIPLTAVVMGYFTLKGVQLGLRWKIQAEQKQLPTMDKPQIINPFEKKPVIPDLSDPNILNEWLNGEKKEGE